MKSTFLTSIVVILSLALSACAGSKFIVKSDPLQADVFVENPKTGQKKQIGVTPLEIPLSNVKETVGEEVVSGEYFTVVIEKKGFVSQRVAVPATRFGTLVTRIEAPLKAGEDQKQNQLASEILDHLFVAQKLALAKEYERAQAELDKILAIAPDFARAHSMMGSVYFLQKKFPESLHAYEKALKNDPKMEEAIKMIARINGQDPSRLPASESGQKK